MPNYSFTLVSQAASLSLGPTTWSRLLDKEFRGNSIPGSNDTELTIKTPLNDLPTARLEPQS